MVLQWHRQLIKFWPRTWWGDGRQPEECKLEASKWNWSEPQKASLSLPATNYSEVGIWSACRNLSERGQPKNNQVTICKNQLRDWAKQKDAWHPWCFSMRPKPKLSRLGGTSKGRRLLSRGCGGLELSEFDDGTGRQRWRVWGTKENGPKILQLWFFMPVQDENGWFNKIINGQIVRFEIFLTWNLWIRCTNPKYPQTQKTEPQPRWSPASVATGSVPLRWATLDLEWPKRWRCWVNTKAVWSHGFLGKFYGSQMNEVWNPVWQRWYWRSLSHILTRDREDKNGPESLDCSFGNVMKCGYDSKSS